jgi:hypothetical protein
MKVKIDCDKRLKERGGTEYEGGWYYAIPKKVDPGEMPAGWDMMSERFGTYAEAKMGAKTAGHEIDNAGWRRKLLMWNWHSHSLDGYPGWEIENPQESEKYSRHPAYAKLEHINKKTKGSDDLCNAWDNIAEVDFYQRDFSYSGSVFVTDGDAYGSGWWFATIVERDRFVRWAQEQMK